MLVFFLETNFDLVHFLEMGPEIRTKKKKQPN